MELKEYVEKTLTEISEGVNAANDKMKGYQVRLDEKVSFVVAVQVSKEKSSEKGADGTLYVVKGGVKSNKTSKDEQFNTVSFDAYFDKIVELKPYERLPNFRV